MTTSAPRLPCLLVVDDIAQNLQLAGEVLSQHFDCDLAFATSGEQALATAQELRPDLILLDVMMPDLGGFEVCRRLKALTATCDIPVVFLTAKSQSQDLAEGFQAGGADYVTKPFDPLELTTRVRHQLDLAAARQELARKNAELSQLLHVLCHDLGNPISAVKGLLDLGEEGIEALADLQPEISASIDQAYKLIQLVGRLRGLEEGKVGLELSALLVTDALSEALHSVRPQVTQKQIHLHFEVPPDLTVRVEPTSFINSVLANLLSNGVKFSLRGGTVTVRAAWYEQQQRVRLEVSDQGIGMPPALVEVAFRADHKTTRPGTEGETGTGFGLPLVQRFVHAYGGTIGITSREDYTHPRDHGTTVVLWLHGGTGGEAAKRG